MNKVVTSKEDILAVSKEIVAKNSQHFMQIFRLRAFAMPGTCWRKSYDTKTAD